MMSIFSLEEVSESVSLDLEMDLLCLSIILCVFFSSMLSLILARGRQREFPPFFSISFSLQSQIQFMRSSQCFTFSIAVSFPQSKLPCPILGRNTFFPRFSMRSKVISSSRPRIQLIWRGYSRLRARSLVNCFQMCQFLAMDLRKTNGLNFQPQPEDLHLPLLTHPRATILPPVDYTSPSQMKQIPLTGEFLQKVSRERTRLSRLACYKQMCNRVPLRKLTSSSCRGKWTGSTMTRAQG